MDKRILYTSSYSNIIKSMAEICGCTQKVIKNYIQNAQPLKNTLPENINLVSFFRDVGVKFRGNTELFNKVKFDACIMSHVTSRINPPNETDVLYLIKVLSEKTDLNIFLESKGITFKETSKGLNTYYNNEKLDLDKFDNSYAARLSSRLRKKGRRIDNCINGFLINDHFWEDSNVTHLKDCPELVLDICHLIKRHDIIREWEETTTPYALGFLADVKDIIFDYHTRYKTINSKVYFIYKNVIYYLIQYYHDTWNPRFDNLMLRLKDNITVSKENIIGFYKIENER